MIRFDIPSREFVIDAGAIHGRTNDVQLHFDDFRLRMEDAVKIAALPDGVLRLDFGSSCLLIHQEDETLRIELQNTGGRPLALKSVRICFGPHQIDHGWRAHECRHLIHSQWFEHLTGVKPMNLPAAWCKDVAAASHLLTVISHNVTRRAILFGVGRLLVLVIDPAA